MISWQNSINITVRALFVCEPSREGEKIRGLIIEFLEGAKLEKINSSFLDIEEYESLLKAIDYMIGLIDKFKTMNWEYTEVTFSTKDEFKVGFYQKGITFTAFVSGGYI